MKYFKSDKNWQFNSRILKTDNKWLYYGEGYREAIHLIEHHIFNVDRSNQDLLIYPYCYLIRHYIEIRLKEIIDEGGKLIQNQAEPIKISHDLYKLWENSQKVLAEIWKYETFNVPPNVSHFISELHSIDLKSDNFRYPFTKSGGETLQNVTEINIKVLTEGFQEVRQFLDGVTDVLAVIKDNNGL